MAIRSPREIGAVAALLLAVGLGLPGCGSDEPEPTQTAAQLSIATANRLARQSERIADQLDSGDICGAAVSADELDGAVAEAEVSAAIRSELEAAAEQLVNSVNCPPPPEPEPEKEKPNENGGEGEDRGDDEGSGGSGDGGSGDGPPGQDGELPPGQQDKYEDAELNQP
jgi:hypothetical protein